jgi:hypothetical protein
LIQSGITPNNPLGEIIKSKQTGTRNGKIESSGGDKSERFGEITGTNDPKRQQWNKPRKQQQKMQFRLCAYTKYVLGDIVGK